MVEEEKEMSRNCDIVTPTAVTQLTTLVDQEQRAYNKKVVRYKECLKNHAAALGGNATDGCGEFMPIGKQGTFESLICSACNCHRNFHKKEIDGESSSILILHNHHHRPPTNHHLLSSRAMLNQQMIVSCRSGSVPSESDEKDGDYDDEIDKDNDKDVRTGAGPVEKPKKRFRTRFTQEQKQKMLYFADKVGWKMQKLDESVVQRFCQEIGIKRRVLKVWMHNNKHHFAKNILLLNN